MKTKRILSLVLAPVLGLMLAGCVATIHPAGEVEVSSPPPPPYADVEVVSPGPDYVWIGGAWFWGGDHWAWRAGHWDHPPYHGAVWVPHRYVNRGGHRVFVEGHWR